MSQQDHHSVEHVKSIFLDAIERTSVQERVAYLDSACGDNAQLRSRVESLLRAHEEAGRFLKPSSFGPNVTPEQSTPVERPGTVIGRYKLLEKIGEGGMAVVYMAEQEKPIHRQVALKIIKLGMDTKQVIARFEAERQALAIMDHPNIAKVIDAGATETGRPYFVMELVKGTAITDYCDKNKLSTKERLNLFTQVCSAVQHAHQKGIIHRDIKPSNVMVTLRDAMPVPKVIDFGIAKATSRKLTEKTLFTRYAQLIGTPAYMSPEQAEFGELDIDTRTDVYSLGVLLYELLTGTPPFSEDELHKAGYLEMQRVIREQEPTKPSTKLSTLGETLSDIARHRASTPDLLRKAIRGDLDWIVMKSLEKDRARRYETVNALAMDIQRHLDSEPVLARGPSAAYRLHKFLQRHRAQTVAAMLIAVVVVAVTVILSMWNRDRLQLAEAEGFRHRNILSQAREHVAKADYVAALASVKSILPSKHVGPEAQLLYAGILVEGRQSDEAVAMLEKLLDDRSEIAGAAHSLLARMLWESPSTDSEKLKKVDEHRGKAEELLSETAEAYFLRAMTVITIKKKFELLGEALRLDPGHYESRRLRALTYYVSRKYEHMKDDALAMIVLRPRESLGYSLQAFAWHQLGQYEKAISAYDNAIRSTEKDDPQYVDLNARRCDALITMNQYGRVIADAQQCLEVVPDALPLELRIFCALTALGHYEEADSLFREVGDSDPAAQSKLRDWSMKYVFDTLEAGRAWHPPPSKPEGVAFLAMLEADETYHQLSAKARRVVTDAFTAHWSPDGTKLGFSTGFWGYNGVAVWNAETGQTDLLIVPGKDPKWSPDGRYLAFVRVCQALPVSELARAERVNRPRPGEVEEVWIMKADGTEPRRLASGRWPCWSHDPNQVYFYSQSDGALCEISIEDTGSKHRPILKCVDTGPEISPDKKHVACRDGTSLKVFELASGLLFTELKFPSRLQGKAWSSDGRELCFGAGKFEGISSGLWVHNLHEKQTRKVLDLEGPIWPSSLAPDGTKLVFNLHAPYFEIWVADLDPNAGVVDSVEPGLTLEEHLQEKLALYTQRIEANPEDANNYYLRAQCHDYLGDRASANADMRRGSAVAGGGQPSDLLFGTRPGFTRVLSLPFDFKLVIGEPTNLGPPVNTSYDEGPMCISPDGLELYFNSDRPGGSGVHDLWVTTRATTQNEWGEPVNLGPTVNSAGGDWAPGMSADGLQLYFTSARPGGSGSEDIWVTTRATTEDDWGPPENLGDTVNCWYFDAGPFISADGLSLYFSCNRPGGSGGADIWVTTRDPKEDEWGHPVSLGWPVNSSADDVSPSISADGLQLYFSDWAIYRPGGRGHCDIWVATRPTEDAPWGQPANLGWPVNTPAGEITPFISPDGSALYFSSNRAGGSGNYDLWQAPVLHWPDDIEVAGGTDPPEMLPQGDEGEEVVPDAKH